MHTTRHPLLLISHGCEVDKATIDVLLVARIRSLLELSGGLQGDVKRAAVRSAMHLPAVSSLPEGFVDFRYMLRALREDLDRADREGRRVASMTVDGRLALQVYLYRFHTRRFPGDPLPSDQDAV